MNPREFVNKYRVYFGDKAPLPIVVKYSKEPYGSLENISGCMFKQLHRAYNGESVSLCKNNLTCGGGKLYTGLGPTPLGVYNFVSNIEKYKQNPEITKKSILFINAQTAEKPFINFIRIDKLENFDDTEGLIFFADPDVISGLYTWANYDQVDINTVQSPWGSGCSSTVTAIVNENRENGKHCFIGLFDISARVFFKSNIISFSIPMSRFKEMLDTIDKCCVSGSPAWLKLRKRINR